MNKRTGAVAFAAGAAMVLASAARGEVQFTPTLGITETWTDNYFLVRSNQPQEEQFVTRANAELLLEQLSERWRARLKYNADTILNGPEKGATFQDGRLDVGTEVLRDWLFLDAAGAYGQYSVDPRIRRNPDPIFPANETLADVGSGSATASLRHNFDRIHFGASYTGGIVRYAREPDTTVALEDSSYRNTSIGLESLAEEARFYWNASYREQRVIYDDSDLRVAHDLAGLDLAFRLTPTLKLLAHGGLESDPRQIDERGGLDQSSWQAGFGWEYGRGVLQLMAGEGVFGDSYDGSLTFSGRILNADLGYHEETTTQIEQFLPFLATDSAGNLISVAGGGVLSGIDDPFGRLTPDVFYQKRLSGRVALTGRLTAIELSLRSEERNYLILGVRDRVNGAMLTINRTLGPRSRVELNARYDTVDVEGSDEFHDQAYSLSFYRQIGRRLQLIATASRAKLTSTDPFTANWIALSLQMSFGRTNGVAPPAPRSMGLPSGTR